MTIIKEDAQFSIYINKEKQLRNNLLKLVNIYYSLNKNFKYVSPWKIKQENGMRQHKMKLFLDFLMGYKNFNDILFVYQLTAHLIVGKKK